MGQPPGTSRLLPYAGDMERWRSETEQAVRSSQAAAGGNRDSAFGLSGLPVRTVERTSWGWIRWGYPLQSEPRFEDAFPAEVGVFAPEQRPGWRPVLARTVWGRRRPAPFVKRIGGAELPATVNMDRLAVVVAAVLFLGPTLGRFLTAGTALTGAAGAGLALAWGGPAVAVVATRRQVRVLDAAAPYAGRIHRLLAVQQEVDSVAAVSEVAELQRAVFVGHRFLWDGVGLVLAADGRGLEVVEEYEAAYERLGRAAARTLRERDRLEDRLAGMDEEARVLPDPDLHGAYRGARHARLLEQAVPVEVLDEIAEGLGELTAGLRHGQDAVARTAGPTLRSGEERDGGR